MIYSVMCDANKDIISKIHSHPFNVELAQGTLPQDKFIFYLVQDGLYLAEFSRALAIVAGRVQHNLQRRQLLEFTLSAIQSEQILHNNYLKIQGINYNDSEPSPACFMYTNYLLNTVSLASIEESIASLLPCFVIYQAVGQQMLQYQHADHPYHDWIDLYSSKEFEDSTDAAIEIVNSLGATASLELQKKMIAAFIKSSQLEWYFWQSAYCKEAWLV